MKRFFTLLALILLVGVVFGSCALVVMCGFSFETVLVSKFGMVGTGGVLALLVAVWLALCICYQKAARI